jgi:hypothetical protein
MSDRGRAAATMSAEQRRTELAELLARGVVRLRCAAKGPTNPRSSRQVDDVTACPKSLPPSVDGVSGGGSLGKGAVSPKTLQDELEVRASSRPDGGSLGVGDAERRSA